jgi:segregation and condensation protein A
MHRERLAQAPPMNAQPRFKAEVKSNLVAMPQPQEGIELLVELAKTGSIDPWNVDLSQVSELYLNAINQGAFVSGQQGQGSEGSVKLRRTGKTLLYLAILLRIKSDLLAGLDPFSFSGTYTDDTNEDGFFLEDAPLEEVMGYDEEGNPILASATQALSAEAFQRFSQALRKRYGSLDTVLERRTSTKQPRIRPVTLEDLIRELKKAEAVEQERAAERRLEVVEKRRRVRDFSQLSTEDITALAHDEFQESYVTQVWQVICEQLPEPQPQTLLEEDASLESFLANEPKLTLEDLVNYSDLPPVICFLSLLFLEARQTICIEQPYFYSNTLWVKRTVVPT